MIPSPIGGFTSKATGEPSGEGTCHGGGLVYRSAPGPGSPVTYIHIYIVYRGFIIYHMSIVNDVSGANVRADLT